jgi:novobiocin biosynthesis protein NovU/D-mycarose 3-C-methyltransferase
VFSCRACAGTDAAVLLDLGPLPLANAFVRPGGPAADEEREPVTLVMCRSCRLLQLREIVARERLFSNFVWVSGTSAAARQHAASLAQRLAGRMPGGGLLVELMSNDGVTLEACRVAGFTVLGVDPSDVAAEARSRGVPSIPAYFGRTVAEQIRAERGPADVILAKHALEHTSELTDLMSGVTHLLRPGGRFVIQVPYAMPMREQTQYDTVFHEHVTYWTVGSLVGLLRRHGLQVRELTFLPVNGGSILTEAVAGAGDPCEAARAALELEDVLRLNDPRGWEPFTRRVLEQRDALRRLLFGLSEGGSKVLGYGAAAKFMVMLNYCGITREQLPLVGDANARKQGLLCPGVRIPVGSPEAVVAAQPDYVLIGAWTFRDEIMQHFREKLGYRGRFLLPLPVPCEV